MKYVLTFVLGLSTAMGFWASYVLGGLDKQSEIVYDCRDYGKYVISESWQITCVGPFNPIYLIPEYKPYTQELKDKNRKNRK